jgi:hypothetical protein
MFETQNAMKLSRGANMTFEDTLTNGALDDLKLKHDNAVKNQYENKIFKSNLKSNNHYFYAKKPNGFRMDESEADHQYYDLKRQNSRAELIDERY